MLRLLPPRAVCLERGEQKPRSFSGPQAFVWQSAINGRGGDEPGDNVDAMHTSSLPSSLMPRFNQVFVSELTVAKRESDKQLIVAQCVVADGRCPTLTPPPHRASQLCGRPAASWSRSPKRSTRSSRLGISPGPRAGRPYQWSSNKKSGKPWRRSLCPPSWPTSHHHRQKWFTKSSTHVVTRMFLRGFQSRHEIATYKPPLRPSIR